MGITEYLFVAVFFGLPGLAGAWLARSRGKNPLLWGLLSAPFPFFIFILWFQKPDHEIPGHFRKCGQCGSIYPWKRPDCTYCGALHGRPADDRQTR